MVDYSIEYVHTYVDESFGEEHIQIIKKVKSIIEEIEGRGQTYSLCVLIDDYNPKVDTLDKDAFIQKLNDFEVAPDFVILESTLAKFETDLFRLMKEGKIRKSYSRYISKKNHIPCSFLVAIWYALRLGIINDDLNKYYFKDGAELVGKKLINVLQSRHIEPENNAKEIILNSEFSDKIDCIEDIFI